jgi:tRNA(Ile2) C34 agmatinyltransferase TiaS
MADFDCPRCGKILREDFPPEVQQQMTSGTYAMVAVGAVVAMASMVVALMFHFLC